MVDGTVMACPKCNGVVASFADSCSFCGAPLRCGRCGTHAVPGEPYCASCGTRLDMSRSDQTSTRTYAGFWKRFAAYMIDSCVLGVGVIVVGVVLALIQGVSSNGSLPASTSLLIDLLSIVGGWLYFALMESSSKQATFGKMAVGIKVTDAHGQRLSMGRASGRYFAKLLSGLCLGAGYLMAGFTKQKQALHDKVANTYVVANAG